MAEVVPVMVCHPVTVADYQVVDYLFDHAVAQVLVQVQRRGSSVRGFPPACAGQYQGQIQTRHRSLRPG